MGEVHGFEGRSVCEGGEGGGGRHLVFLRQHFLRSCSILGRTNDNMQRPVDVQENAREKTRRITYRILLAFAGGPEFLF